MSERSERMKVSSDALLACPFCGCDPVHQRVEEYCEGEWYVVCEVCRATGPRCDTEERARRYWNQSHANTQISGGTPSAEAGCSAFRIAYPRDDKQYEYVEQRHMIEYPSAKAGWEQIVRHDGMAGQPCFYVWRRLRRPNTQISGGTPSADLGVRRLEVTDGSAIQSR